MWVPQDNIYFLSDSYLYFCWFTETRTADELSKIMAFFYYGAAKPSCLDAFVMGNDAIPGFTVNK